jgi:hypothetical protein
MVVMTRRRETAPAGRQIGSGDHDGVVTVPLLVGRDREQQALSAALDGASVGVGGLVLVTGEAGIGKTSLVTAALAQVRAEGALVATGTCWDGEAAPGYWPWTQAVRALRLETPVAAWERAAAEAGAGLDRLLGVRGPVTEETSAFDVIDAVTALLQVLSREQLVVVALDDLQWADRPSLALLSAMVGAARLGRILLVGTYRDDEVALSDHRLHLELGELAARATSIHLTGLDVDACAVLLARDPRSATVPTATEVHTRTGGNPFFVQQLVQLWASSGTSSAALPAVGAVIDRRLARLPAPVADALAGASVPPVCLLLSSTSTSTTSSCGSARLALPVWSPSTPADGGSSCTTSSERPSSRQPRPLSAAAGTQQRPRRCSWHRTRAPRSPPPK